MPTRAVTPTTTATPTATSTLLPTPTPTMTPRPTSTPTASASPTPTPRPTLPPQDTSTPGPPDTSLPSPTPWPSPTPEHNLLLPEIPGAHGHPTLADFWAGRAEFVVEVPYTGLPLGESETLVMRNGEWWSYVHASAASAGIVDRCGKPVPFPGCTVIYRSVDGGRTFTPPNPPVCQFECLTCPCTSEGDHIEQQQYPRVAYNGATLFLVYEYLGRTRLRRSTDGLLWSAPERVADTGIWKLWLRSCRPEERIGRHPFVPYDYECLAGAPPGILVEGSQVYVFVGLGQNPGAMGCYVGAITTPAEHFVRCTHNPLFVGTREYGPLEEKGAAAAPYFDFRTISSAAVQRVGDRVYMFYEGVRGPGPGDPGDSQFGLGLARSLTAQVDGPWETYPGNPLLAPPPGNVGLGHADVVVAQGRTYLYTSLDGAGRSRLVLVWK